MRTLLIKFEPDVTKSSQASPEEIIVRILEWIRLDSKRTIGNRVQGEALQWMNEWMNKLMKVWWITEEMNDYKFEDMYEDRHMEWINLSQFQNLKISLK